MFIPRRNEIFKKKHAEKKILKAVMELVGVTWKSAMTC
jgi:hypothetical protein